MSGFNPKDYEAQIAASRERIAKTSRFEEPDRVPVLMSCAGSYYSWMMGVNIRDYYADIDTQIDVQLFGLEWAFGTLQDDRTSYGLYLDPGPIGEALLFDMEIIRPDNTSPWAVRKLTNPDDILTMEVPDPRQARGVQEHLKRIERLKERVRERGIDLPAGGGLGIHPPMSCATALMEVDLVYELLYTRPDLAHILLDKCLQAYFALVDYMAEVNGNPPPTSIGLADDNSAFISPKMYREFVLPRNKAIYDRYGRDGRYLHADGPNDHLFKIIVDELGVTHMDIGGWSDIAAAKPAFAGKAVMQGNINTKDLYYDFAHAKPAVDRCLRIGAPGAGYIFAVGGELYPGAKPETVIEVVKYVKKEATYPFDAAKFGGQERQQ
jgi:uroporphyrinogen-III decarboxylase